MKKIIILTVIIMSLTLNYVFAAEVNIKLSNDVILIDGKEITNDIQSDVYLQKSIEIHPDVLEENKNIENKIITIIRVLYQQRDISNILETY